MKAVTLAKIEIEKMRQKKIKDNVKETINNRKFGGKLPNSWLTNPLPGELIDDCLLPIKCPLHDNFDKTVLDSGGQLFKVQVFKVTVNTIKRPFYIQFFYGTSLN